MKAFWSGTDTNTIEGTPSADFTVSLVINLKEEYKLRVQYFHPVMAHEDVELNILGAPKVVTDEMKKEVKELCETNSITTYKSGTYRPHYNAYGGYGATQQTLSLIHI